MPSPGHFILHDHAQPALEAGSYEVQATHTYGVDGADADPIAPLSTRIEVTGPRFVLPASEILSTFPPNRAEGAFGTRLPQIVLKRRTLPWERKLDGASRTDTPWLALVVVAEGEAELLSDVPVAEAVTAGVTLDGRKDAERTTALRVTQSVVDQVFPAPDELHLLTHVREVDVTDTELGLGDDDGWMAVVIANRLPQSGGKYHACLISLEGQLDVLPTAHEIADAPGSKFVFDWIEPALAGVLVGAPNASLTGPVATQAPQTAAQPLEAAGQDAWSLALPKNASVQAYATATKTRFVHTDFTALLPPMERRYTFPVLAHFSFACTEAGDFQSRMQHLDVDLFGTAPPPPVVPPGKPIPEPTRPPPEIAETGHLELDAVAREGDPARIWYRGPLLPRPGTRAPHEADGTVPLHHVSDELRAVGPDGLENLSLAVAFEIGRLLALADPGVVSAFLRWRRDRFHTQRKKGLFEIDPRLRSVLALSPKLLGALAGKTMLLDLVPGGRPVIGPILPVVDPGVLPFSGLTDPLPVIERGLGVSLGGGEPPVTTLESGFDALVGNAGALGGLRAAQSRELDRLAALATEFGRGGGLR